MVDPLDLQREETVFEKLAAQEVRVTSSGLPKFSKSPLTEAALRGTDYQGNVTPRDRVLAAARASRTARHPPPPGSVCGPPHAPPAPPA